MKNNWASAYSLLLSTSTKLTNISFEYSVNSIPAYSLVPDIARSWAAVALDTLTNITNLIGWPLPSWQRASGACSSLNHWGRMTHTYVSKLRHHWYRWWLAPVRRQVIIWTRAGILLIGSMKTNFSDFYLSIFIQYPYRKNIWKCLLRNDRHFASACVNMGKW